MFYYFLLVYATYPHDYKVDFVSAGMHRKSIEAARHLKESGSEREGSEAEPERPTSASSHHHDNHDAQVRIEVMSTATNALVIFSRSKSYNCYG